jgi:tape measure domain-containing protein
MANKSVNYTLRLTDLFSNKIKNASASVATLNKSLLLTQKRLNLLGSFKGATSPMGRLSRQTSTATIKNNNYNKSLLLTKQRLDNLKRSRVAFDSRMTSGSTSSRDVIDRRSSTRGLANHAVAGRAMGGGGGIVSRGLLPAAAAGFATISIVDATAQMQALENQFRFASGGVKEGAADLAFINERSKFLGISFEATARSYAKLAAATKGSRLEKETRGILEGVATAASVMHLTADETNRVIFALQQMVSKGKVSSEELNRQLGEVLPGANKLFAQSLNMTTQELAKAMKNGEIYAEDTLPKFARRLKEFFGTGLADSRKSLQSELSRMGTAWFEFKSTLGLAVLPQIIATIRGLTRLMDTLLRLPSILNKNAEAVTGLMLALSPLIAIWAGYKTYLIIVTVKQWALNAALAFGKIMMMGWSGLALVAAASLAVYGIGVYAATSALKGLTNARNNDVKASEKQISSLLGQRFGLQTPEEKGFKIPFINNNKLSELDQMKADLERLRNGGAINTDGTPVTSTSSSTTAVEARQPQNFNITIGSLVESLDVISNNLQEGAEDVKEIVIKTFVEAVNNFQLIAAK